jgi:hypothetical protein
MHIARVPEKTKTRFMQLAKEEFEDDWGQCLKWILDYRDGILCSPNQILEERINILADEIALLKGQPKEKEVDRSIKMINGNVVRIGGKKDE